MHGSSPSSLVISTIGSCLMFFVKKRKPVVQPVIEIVPSANQDNADADKKEAVTPKEEDGACKMIAKKAVSVVKCMFEKRMLLLFMLFLNNGYAQLLVSSQLTRQISNVKYVGLAMAEYSVVEVITTVVCGYVADRVGSTVMVGSATLFELLGVISACVMSKYQGWWIFVPPTFLGIVDTIYQTECISIVGRSFRDNIEEAFSTFRLVQGLGSSLCSYLTPFFISSGATSSSPKQLVIEMVVAEALSVVSFILYLVFSHVQRKREHSEVNPSSE